MTTNYLFYPEFPTVTKSYFECFHDIPFLLSFLWFFALV